MAHRLQRYRKTLWPLGGHFDLESWNERIGEIERLQSAPDYWNNPESASALNRELKTLHDTTTQWTALKRDITELNELWELFGTETASSAEGEQLVNAYQELSQRYSALSLTLLLNEEYDDADCFMSIQSGAGGTESCDWVSMLYRMYLRWCERKKFTPKVLDVQEAEGGIKSVTVEVAGSYAYGYLKAEHGVHRLVRISPFDANKRRHTTFASIVVVPNIQTEIDVEIRPDDIRIDTYRASGAGGQHVNKTDSAVRITHLETGIVVQCQNERSQHRNKEVALHILKSRLYNHYSEQERAKQSQLAGNKQGIAWGSQIRSYIFQPYSLVKDHRFECETGNIGAVMDGEIDSFISAFLRARI